MKTSVRVKSELSEEFRINVGMHPGSVLPPFGHSVVVYVVTQLAKDGVLSELLHADDLVIDETTEGLKNKLKN